MKFQRPIVPTRWLELFYHGIGALFIVAIGLYGLLAARDGLIKWQDVPILVFIMSIGALPVFAFGYFFRRWRLKKRAELREYERVLASLSEGN
ncbi:MAG: hypothetical protein CL955_10500 [Erythrobacteraceae bacterium]|nr:hypothetical protein [Erythrobacteraceae bacterium]